ncbi:hypothetical protein BsWGS_10520 [Bradybaena similaris]
MVQKRKVRPRKRLRSPPRTQLKTGRIAKWLRRKKCKQFPHRKGPGPSLKIPRRSKNALMKIPVVPVMKISVIDCRRSNAKNKEPKCSPSRYILVTPVRQGGSCGQRSPPRSVSQCSRSGSRDKRRSRSRRRHRSRPRSRSISRARRGKCKCSCNGCQKCEYKTHRRSRSNCQERERRKSGSQRSCSGSRSDSEQRKTKATCSRKTSAENARQSPVKTFMERVSTVFNRKECKGGNETAKKNISSNKDMEKEQPHESRRSRSRSPNRDKEKEQPRESRNRSPNKDKETEQPRESRNRSPNKDKEKEQPRESRSRNRSSPRRRHHHHQRPSSEVEPMCCVM